ncbi:MAG: MarR family winged helix-turn-helix transcriptional regulator [Actinomycetes bacterium]
MDRAGNLLGALALVVSDRMVDAVEDTAHQSVTTATALSSLHHFLDAPSVDLLRQVLGLTSSGTVRLVDRLEQAGYVRRRPGRDGRTTSVVLTASGRRVAARVAAARAEVLDGALSVLPRTQRREFEANLSRVLVGLMRGPGATRWMCRLCDTSVCGRTRGECPVANEASRRYGGPTSDPSASASRSSKSAG